ncbi:MAG: zinc-dependent alcohol dehydrogenase family protein [Ardenticatenaceae bacterium]|nr:zinc-dependent alcohol dehydrogenase family protein [Ardenticatenaceae bacterium]
MKAIVYEAPEKFSYTDVPDPQIRPHEVLIRVRACGICGTDLHIHEGEFLAEFPLIPGHEVAGEVAEVGSAVFGWRVGDKVAVDNTELCGHCFYCRRNQPLYCENFGSHGCNMAGGLAEYVAIPAEKLFRLHNLSWREAIMAEPLACAVHGMDVIALKPGNDVLLFGAGPTGIVLAQLLKLNGAAHLTVAAPAGPKLDLAAKLAADAVVAIDRNDYAQHRAYLLDKHPHGFDTVIEATGAAQLCEESLQYARMGGQVIVYGVYPESARISWSPTEIFRRELTIKGSFAQTHCLDRALSYLESGQVKVDEVVTQVFPLSGYGEALAALRSRQGIKSAVMPD